MSTRDGGRGRHAPHIALPLPPSSLCRRSPRRCATTSSGCSTRRASPTRTRPPPSSVRRLLALAEAGGSPASRSCLTHDWLPCSPSRSQLHQQDAALAQSMLRLLDVPWWPTCKHACFRFAFARQTAIKRGWREQVFMAKVRSPGAAQCGEGRAVIMARESCGTSRIQVRLNGGGGGSHGDGGGGRERERCASALLSSLACGAQHTRPGKGGTGVRVS